MFLRPGKGDITVNGRTFENYFPSEASRAIVRQPLLATETADKFDILITTAGGGPSGQAGAAKLGIARALLEFNVELRAKLKELGLLTRDRAPARAQEVRAEGRAQTLPVLQTLRSFGAFVRSSRLDRHGACPHCPHHSDAANPALGRGSDFLAEQPNKEVFCRPFV